MPDSVNSVRMTKTVGKVKMRRPTMSTLQGYPVVAASLHHWSRRMC